MKKITDGLKAIWKSDKLLIVVMLLSALLGGVIIVSALMSLAPSGMGTNVGYGDVGGYREGNWYYYVGFAMLGLIVGLGHNIIAIWLYGDKGRGAAMVFLLAGILVGVLAFATLIGLVGGGL